MGRSIVQDASTPSDSDLVAAALADKRAYAHVLRRWEPLLARYVRRILGRESQAADDVLQEAFLKAYVNLNDYDRTRPFGAWIYRIARNEAINHLRKRKIEPPFVNGDDALLLLGRLSDGITAQEIFDGARMNERIRAAIDAMPARYREALALRYLEDRGYDEIAEIMQLPSGTVATLINRGTKQLRASLKAAASSGLL